MQTARLAHSDHKAGPAIMTIESCQVLDLPKIHDPRGNLTFVEGNTHVPFAIERVYYLYDVDDEEHLQGVVSLRDLVVSPPERPVSEFMLKEVVRMHVDAGVDEITKTLDHYNLLAVPVVDSENRIQGVITIDDIMQAVMPRTWRRRLSRMLG